MNKHTVQQYIDLCKKLCFEPSDYGSKQNLRQHNRAMRALRKYADELNASNDASSIFSDLLDHPDRVVAVVAAADCLRMNLHTDKAQSVLVHALSHENRMIAFDAEMTLKSWQNGTLK